MQTNIDVSYSAERDGGVTICLTIPQGSLSLPLDHESALWMAATILHNAGVTRAQFKDGQLLELVRAW